MNSYRKNEIAFSCCMVRCPKDASMLTCGACALAASAGTWLPKRDVPPSTRASKSWTGKIVRRRAPHRSRYVTQNCFCYLGKCVWACPNKIMQKFGRPFREHDSRHKACNMSNKSDNPCLIKLITDQTHTPDNKHWFRAGLISGA